MVRGELPVEAEVVIMCGTTSVCVQKELGSLPNKRDGPVSLPLRDKKFPDSDSSEFSLSIQRKENYDEMLI